jgi:hypothetical protein
MHSHERHNKKGERSLYKIRASEARGVETVEYKRRDGRNDLGPEKRGLGKSAG